MQESIGLQVSAIFNIVLPSSILLPLPLSLSLSSPFFSIFLPSLHFSSLGRLCNCYVCVWKWRSQYFRYNDPYAALSPFATFRWPSLSSSSSGVYGFKRRARPKTKFWNPKPRKWKRMRADDAAVLMILYLSCWFYILRLGLWTFESVYRIHMLYTHTHTRIPRKEDTHTDGDLCIWYANKRVVAKWKWKWNWWKSPSREGGREVGGAATGKNCQQPKCIVEGKAGSRSRRFKATGSGATTVTGE